MRLCALLALTASLIACGSAQPDCPEAAAAPPATAPTAPPLTLSAEHASPVELLALLRTVSGQPIAIDLDALERAQCMRIDIASHQASASDAYTEIVAALARVGLRVHRTPAALVVARDPAMELPCPAPAIEEALAPADDASDQEVASPVEGITQVSPVDIRIRRDAIDALLANPESLMRAARILPHFEGDALVGMRLLGIRSGTLLAAAGLQNGDIVRVVAGHPLSSMEARLETAGALRDQREFTVELTRRGEPLSIHYTIEE